MFTAINLETSRILLYDLSTVTLLKFIYTSPTATVSYVKYCMQWVETVGIEPCLSWEDCLHILSFWSLISCNDDVVLEKIASPQQRKIQECIHLALSQCCTANCRYLYFWRKHYTIALCTFEFTRNVCFNTGDSVNLEVCNNVLVFGLRILQTVILHLVLLIWCMNSRFRMSTGVLRRGYIIIGYKN